MSPGALAESEASVEAEAAAARRQLDLLAGAGREDAAERMRELLDELLLSAQQLEDARPQLAQILRDSASSRQELVAATSWRLLPAAVASEDDLFYSIVAGRADAEGQVPRGTDTISADDLLLYARLALLTQQIDQGYIALEVATRQWDSEFIGTVEEAANLVMHQLRDNLDSLSETDRQYLDPMLIPLARDLVDAAYGEANLIDQMKARLRLADGEAQLAASVDAVASSLQAEADGVLAQAIGRIELADGRREAAAALQAALGVQQHAAAVTSQSTVRTTANTPLVEMPEIRGAVAADISSMRRELDTLGDLGHGTAVAPMYSEIDHLESNVERIHDGRPELADALQSAARDRAQLRSFLDYQLEPVVVVSLDNQLYYMLTGRSEFRGDGSVDSDPLSRVEFMRYRHLSSAYTSLFRTFSGLIIAIIMTEPALIGEGEERFLTASHRLERSIELLEEDGGAELDPQVVSLARQFIGFGNGESSLFDALRHRLPLVAAENELIEANRQIHSGLQVDLDALLDGILRDAVSPAGDSGTGESSARTIVLVLGILAAVMTLLAAAMVARRNAAIPA